MDLLQQLKKCRKDMTDKFKDFNEPTANRKELNDETIKIITKVTDILVKVKKYANDIIEELKKLRDIIREFNGVILDLLNTVIEEKKQSVEVSAMTTDDTYGQYGNRVSLSTRQLTTRQLTTCSSISDTDIEEENLNYALLAQKQAELVSIIIDVEGLLAGAFNSKFSFDVMAKLQKWADKVQELKNLENERLKREDEKKLEAERQTEETERREKEKAERKRRDHANWKPITYERPEPIEAEEPSYYGGIGAVVYAIEKGLRKEQLKCTFSDEDNDLQLCRGNERDVILSDVTTIQSAKKIVLDAPMQLYIPYSKPRSGKDVRLKISVDDLKFQIVDQAQDRKFNVPEGILLVGCEVNNFRKLQIAAVEVRLSKTKTYTGKETTIQVTNDIQVVIHSSDKPCEANIRIEYDDIDREDFDNTKKIHPELKYITPTEHFIITTDTPISAQVEVKTGTDGVLLQKSGILNEWEELKAESAERNKSYMLQGIESTAGFVALSYLQKSILNRATETFLRHTSHYQVRMICRQNKKDPTNGIIECIPLQLLDKRIKELQKDWSSPTKKNPAESREFCINDGDKLLLESYDTLQAEFGPKSITKAELTFNSVKGIASISFRLACNGTKFSSSKSVIGGNISWHLWDGAQKQNTGDGGLFCLYISNPKEKSEETERRRGQEKAPFKVTLDRLYDVIVSDLSVKPMLDYLTTKEVFTDVEMADVRTASRQSDQIRSLIELIKQKGNNAYKYFLEGLEKNKQDELRKQILSKEKEV